MYTLENLISLFAFVFVGSVTPGPNTLMLMTSGANFGFRKTLPHLLGVIVGFGVMALLGGIGLIQVFQIYPTLYKIFKVVSSCYLIYLAYRIATSTRPTQGDRTKTRRPLTFIEAALFQWVNPKAWAIALSAISLYSPNFNIDEVLFICFAFIIVIAPSASVWTFLGESVKKLLVKPDRLRVFNYSMAILLLGTLSSLFI